MKKTAQDFGSHWNRPASRVRTEESAETTCDSEDEYLGFRLVSGSGVGMNRGNSWDFEPELARVNRTDIDDINEIAPLISFRLAREDA
jgi:hypothetical protein